MFPIFCLINVNNLKQNIYCFCNRACLLYGFSIVVWNIETKEAICGSPASAQSAGHCLSIEYTNLSDEVFISAGK